MAKIPSLKKVVMVIIVIFGLVFVILSAFDWHKNQQLNFQAYSPTFLPAGIRITGHSTDVISGEGEHYKSVSISTNLPNFGIGEEKSTDQEYEMTTFSCRSKLTNSTCVSLTSPKGQQYDIQSIFNTKSMKVITQNISWKHNSTRFWITLNSDLILKFAKQSWGHVIDSFEPTSYGNEPGKNIRVTGG